MNFKRMYLTALLGMIFCLLWGGVGTINAQTKTVAGTVSDDKGELIVSGTVRVKGTQTATITDIDGKYSISAPAGGTLVFSYLGYLSQEIPVAQAKNGKLNVVLKAEDTTLDELVVVGYGTMRKSDLTGSVSNTKGADIIKQQSFNALDGLKGKAAGVNIFSNTGQPGGEMRVIIRGIATINASTSPLYIVDGVARLQPSQPERYRVYRGAEGRFCSSHLRCSWCQRCDYGYHKARQWWTGCACVL